MNGSLYPLVALFAWTILASSIRRLPAIRKEPTRLATWYLYVCFALIFTISWAGVWNRIDSWTGLPASNVLISQCLVICYCALQTTVLELWAYAPDQARRRVKITISVYAAVLVAMITLFLRCDTSDDLQQSLKAHNLQPGFNEWYGGSAEYESYLLIYLTTISAGAVVVIRLCRRYAKAISPSWLRTGLNTTAVGAALGELYSLTRLTDIIAARAKVDIAPWENVAEASAGLGSLLIMIGLTLHWWGPRISAFARRLRRLVAYIRLRPLWARFYTLDASIAFDDRRHAGSGSVLGRVRAATRVLRDVDYHLTRRVVEIRDGILTLRPYQDPAYAESVRAHFISRGIEGDDLEAAVAAEQIHAALEACGATTRNDGPASPAAGNVPANIDAELTWLLKVTNYFIGQSTARPNGLADADPTPTGGIA
ncbi:hypothetical protein ABIA31_008490 [Catenulispora sp. MAP5-51]|uniref:MAB_1171c family putative transporter n=1 Tax=Catenulispora sp. MAP5-51 TaxID=3156298 RepID=UPI00351392C8